MKEKLTEALTGLIETITTTTDFVLAQAPDVIQQLVAYSTMKYSIWLGLFCVAWVVYIAGVTRCYKTEAAKENGDQEPTVWIGLIFGCILGFATAGVLMPLLKITIAPKVWLIEYAARLVG